MRNWLFFLGMYCFSIHASGQSVREVKAYWDVFNTRLRAVEHITDDYKLHGEQLYYYENGDLKERLNYKFDKKEGVQYVYFHNGKPRLKNNYKEGLQHGISEEFKYDGDKYYRSMKSKFENGDMIERIDYYPSGKPSTEIKANGISKVFFKSGQLMRTDVYVNGQANGESKTYDDQGNLIEEGFYKNQYKDGEYKYYNKKGEVYLVENYETGTLVGNLTLQILIDTATLDFSYGPNLENSNGRLMVNFEKDYDKSSGYLYPIKLILDDDIILLESFDFWGMRTETIKQKFGVEGFTRYYYTNGQVESEGTYRREEKIDTWSYYTREGELIKQEIYTYKYGQRQVFTKTKAEIDRDNKYFMSNLSRVDSILKLPTQQIDSGLVKLANSIVDTLQELRPTYGEFDSRRSALELKLVEWNRLRSERIEKEGDQIFETGDFEAAYLKYSRALYYDASNDSAKPKIDKCLELKAIKKEKAEIAEKEFFELIPLLQIEEMDVHRIYTAQNEAQKMVSSYSSGLISSGKNDRIFESYKVLVTSMKSDIDMANDPHIKLQIMKDLIQLHANMKTYKEGKSKKLQKALKEVSGIKEIKELLLITGLELIK